MSDAALEFAEEHGLGKVLGRVRLGSGLAISGGARSRANLLLSESGLWLVAARDRFHGEQLDLLTRGDVRLIAGRIRDQLCFGQETLTIPAGRRQAVERLIALARLSSGTAPACVTPQFSRLVERSDELGEAWLRRELARDEVIVAWLRGESLVPVNSHLVGETRRAPYLFVTERRAAIVVWSAVGDVSYTPLEASCVRARAEGDKTELAYPAGEFLSRRADGRACRDAFELLSLEPGQARLLEAARRSWLTADRSKFDTNRSLALLEAATDLGSQKGRFAWLLADAELRGAEASIDSNAVAQALAAGDLAPHALADLWLGFRFSEQAGGALVRALLELGADPGLPFAFVLQRRIHDSPGADAEVAKDELRLAQFAVQARLASSAVQDERDRAIAGVLVAQGLARRPSTFAPPQRPLSSELLEGTLTHPLARGQNSLVAGAQKAIALSPEPDRVALNDYCEALDGGLQPEAKRALDATRLLFCLPDLRAYVSRGKKSIGMRGYEGEPPYILLGKEHLDPASAYGMTEAELAFAIGVEALHLKLGQARLTSNEVWAGAWSHTKGGVELALGLLPLLKGLPLATSVTKFLDKVPEPALRRGLETLVRFERRQRRTPEPSEAPSALSHINEHLVAAHRLMQMSADRAGLVLSGDLRASLRGMLLVRPDTRALLDAMVERGLVTALLDSEIDTALQRDLLVRVAALFHFFESDDYLALRRALHPS